MRLIILNLADSFPNNNSWRFFTGDINGDYIEDSLIINSNNNNASINVNWTGYKVGDVMGQPRLDNLNLSLCGSLFHFNYPSLA